MIGQDTLEGLAGKEAELGVGQRRDSIANLIREGLTHKVGGIKQSDDLLAPVSRARAQLEHARQEIGADQIVVAGPGERLVASDTAAAAEPVERFELHVGEAAAQRLITDAAVGAEILRVHESDIRTPFTRIEPFLIEINSVKGESGQEGPSSRSIDMAIVTANLHLIIPIAAATLFMAVVAFVSIEQAFGRN